MLFPWQNACLTCMKSQDPAKPGIVVQALSAQQVGDQSQIHRTLLQTLKTYYNYIIMGTLHLKSFHKREQDFFETEK